MKLTTQRLKKLIQEQMSEMMEPSEHDVYGTEQDYAEHAMSVFELNGTKIGLQVDMESQMIEIFEINPENGMPVFRKRVPLKM